MIQSYTLLLLEITFKTDYIILFVAQDFNFLANTISESLLLLKKTLISTLS